MPRIFDLIAVVAVAIVLLLPKASLEAKPALSGAKIELDRIAELEDLRFVEPANVDRANDLAVLTGGRIVVVGDAGDVEARAGKGNKVTYYDNADFGEALVLSHCNATHLPNADFPVYDPDVYYSFHTGGCHFLFGDGSVQSIRNTIAGTVYEAIITRAGDEANTNWDN